MSHFSPKSLPSSYLCLAPGSEAGDAWRESGYGSVQKTCSQDRPASRACGPRREMLGRAFSSPSPQPPSLPHSFWTPLSAVSAAVLPGDPGQATASTQPLSSLLSARVDATPRGLPFQTPWLSTPLPSLHPIQVGFSGFSTVGVQLYLLCPSPPLGFSPCCVPIAECLFKKGLGLVEGSVFFKPRALSSDKNVLSYLTCKTNLSRSALPGAGGYPLHL